MKTLRSKAFESLDSSSTQENFILELSKVAAKFISDNRDSFSQEDTIAVQELADVFAVKEVLDKILEFVADPPEVPVDIVEESRSDNTFPLDTTTAGTEDDMVSEDVMALLNEEQ